MATESTKSFSNEAEPPSLSTRPILAELRDHYSFITNTHQSEVSDHRILLGYWNDYVGNFKRLFNAMAHAQEPEQPLETFLEPSEAAFTRLEWFFQFHLNLL